MMGTKIRFFLLAFLKKLLTYHVSRSVTGWPTTLRSVWFVLKMQLVSRSHFEVAFQVASPSAAQLGANNRSNSKQYMSRPLWVMRLKK